MINWRRFFDINELVAMRVEDDEVFEAVHATIFRLYAEGLLTALRVDHIDGLGSPQTIAESCGHALRDLRPRGPERPLERAYFVVEKILARDESLPQIGGPMGPPATTSWMT